MRVMRKQYRQARAKTADRAESQRPVQPTHAALRPASGSLGCVGERWSHPDEHSQPKLTLFVLRHEVMARIAADRFGVDC